MAHIGYKGPAVKLKPFAKVNIEISNICNLQCSFCPEVVRTKKLMDVDLFRGVIGEVAQVANLVTFHLMGDPLVHPRLAELVELTHEQGLQIYFVTNGVLLGEKEKELLLHPAFRQVSFSLHAFADNFPGKPMGPYLDKIFDFTERALEKRPDLYVNFRLWNLTSPRGLETDNLEVLEHIERRFGVTLPRTWSRQANGKAQKSYLVKQRLYLHFDTEFVWPGIDLPEIGAEGTCQALSNHIGILADGTVVPCCLDKEAAIPLGNLKTQGLKEILASDRANAIYAGFRQGKLVEDLCRRCQYIERFQPQLE